MLKVLQSDIGLWKILTENSMIFNGHMLLYGVC